MENHSPLVTCEINLKACNKCSGNTTRIGTIRALSPTGKERLHEMPKKVIHINLQLGNEKCIACCGSC